MRAAGHAPHRAVRRGAAAAGIRPTSARRAGRSTAALSRRRRPESSDRGPGGRPRPTRARRTGERGTARRPGSRCGRACGRVRRRRTDALLDTADPSRPVTSGRPRVGGRHAHRPGEADRATTSRALRGSCSPGRGRRHHHPHRQRRAGAARRAPGVVRAALSLLARACWRRRRSTRAASTSSTSAATRATTLRPACASRSAAPGLVDGRMRTTVPLRRGRDRLLRLRRLDAWTAGLGVELAADARPSWATRYEEIPRPRRGRSSAAHRPTPGRDLDGRDPAASPGRSRSATATSATRRGRRGGTALQGLSAACALLKRVHAPTTLLELARQPQHRLSAFEDNGFYVATSVGGPSSTSRSRLRWLTAARAVGYHAQRLPTSASPRSAGRARTGSSAGSSGLGRRTRTGRFVRADYRCEQRDTPTSPASVTHGRLHRAGGHGPLPPAGRPMMRAAGRLPRGCAARGHAAAAGGSARHRRPRRRGPLATPTPAPVSRRRPAPVATPEYRVGPGDVLEVVGLRQRRPLAQPPPSRPTATVSLPLLGRREGGRPHRWPRSRRKLTSLLGRDYLVNPQVDVKVKEYQSQFVTADRRGEQPGQEAAPRAHAPDRRARGGGRVHAARVGRDRDHARGGHVRRRREDAAACAWAPAR